MNSADEKTSKALAVSKKVLFVCRGNAFRSIIAEAILRSRQLPDVVSLSAGSVAAQFYHQNGNGYEGARKVLAEHGIDNSMKDHYGDQLTQELLDSVDVVILLNDIVRREAEAARLTLPSYTQIWSVVDIGEAGRIPKDEEEHTKYKEELFVEISSLIDNLVASGFSN